MTDSSLCSNNVHIIKTYHEEPRRRFKATVVEADVKEHKKRCFTVREKILILIIAFMLIFCVVMLNLYLKERNQNQRTEVLQSNEFESRDNRTTGNPDITTASQAFEVCSTQECAQTSSDILEAMNKSVDPCVDFYQYACGGWIAKNPIPRGRSSWDHFTRLQLDLNQLLTRLLTSPETEAKYAKNEAVTKTLNYYRSCMDTAQINKREGRPLKALVTSYGSSPITSKTWNESAWHFAESFVKIHRDQNALLPFLRIRIENDWENSSKYIMIIDKASSALTSVILQNNSFATRIQNAYKGFMINMSKLMDGENSFLANTEELYQFEKGIARIINNLPVTSTMRDCKLISLRRLCAKACKQINWLRILQRLMEGSGHQITGHNEIRLCSLEYLKKISRLISKTSKRVLANYMMWRVVQVHYRELSTTYEEVFRNYMTSAFQSSTSIPNEKREAHCLDKVRNLFGLPLGRMYIDSKIKPESKKMVTKIVGDIRESFRNNLQGLDWMDSATRKKAIDKVEALLAQVGYPDYITDNESLSAKYKNVVIHRKTFFENQLSYQRNDKQQLFKKLSLPVDRSEWHASPVVINAFYNDAVNSMIFPASIFQPPFLHLGSSWAVNYGAIGTFVAHELTHGFDDQGRRYDSHGNLAMWWDLQTLLAFRNKTKCLRDQYGNYSFHGFKVKGASSLSENIADNGAVKQAYHAYRRWVSQNGEEPILPGVKLSNDQVFFLSYAQIWCASNTKRDARYNFFWGTYAPKPWRVKGSLRNFPEFARSFNCRLGSPMNPKKKCAVW